MSTIKFLEYELGTIQKEIKSTRNTLRALLGRKSKLTSQINELRRRELDNNE